MEARLAQATSIQDPRQKEEQYRSIIAEVSIHSVNQIQGGKEGKRHAATIFRNRNEMKPMRTTGENGRCSSTSIDSKKKRRKKKKRS